MRLGLDFRAMQIGHQFRGIGQVIRETCRQLDASLPSDDTFVLFWEEGGPGVDQYLDELGVARRHAGTFALPPARNARVQRFQGGMSDAQEAVIGSACDVLLQFDFSLGVPSGTPTVLVVYDQVPVLLGDRFPDAYRPSYRAARASGQSVRGSAERALSRLTYERGLTAALRDAEAVLAISEHTAGTTNDFARDHGLGDLSDHIAVAHLGHHPHDLVDPALSVLEAARVAALGLVEEPFLLFMGGVDQRRRVDLLVTAFNHLRAEGREIKLVLAGYDFQSLDHIFTPTARRAIESSSYRDDIVMLGYISDAERAWLYHRAEAFVFPTEHEGFGLPLVEALATGCTVVSFDTTSISELRGPNCHLCEPTWPALVETIGAALDRPEATRAQEAEEGRAWAATFTWDAFGERVTDLVEGLRPSSPTASGPRR